MSNRREMSADEVRKRLHDADIVIDLGASPLLAPTSSKFTDEEAERSLFRLLKGVTDPYSGRRASG